MPTFRLYLDSIGAADWRDVTFNMPDLSILTGDIYKAPYIKMRVERFVWQDRVVGTDEGFTVHLENVDQMGAYWARAPMPRLVHYGRDNVYTAPCSDIGALTTNTNWLQQKKLRVGVRDFQNQAYAIDNYGATANWFMTLVLEWD